MTLVEEEGEDNGCGAMALFVGIRPANLNPSRHSSSSLGPKTRAYTAYTTTAAVADTATVLAVGARA